MGRGPEGEIAFWIQFAEVWKSLAELAESPVREECLKKAAACLRRATAVRQRTTGKPTSGAKTQADGARPGAKAASKTP
jgi:hypothetical protein